MNTTALSTTEAVRDMLDNVGEWWRVSFPPALVIFIIFCALGKFFGWLITKILTYGADDWTRSKDWFSMRHIKQTELDNVGAWKHLTRGTGTRFTSSTPSEVYNPTESGSATASSGVKPVPGESYLQTGLDPVGDVSTSFVAKIIRWFWKGGLSQDAAVVLGHVVSIVIYCIGALVALSYAGLQLAPLIAAGGITAFTVSVAMRDVLGNFFCGIVLLYYDTVRAGGAPRPPPCD